MKLSLHNTIRRFVFGTLATTALSLTAATATAQDSRVVVVDERNMNQPIPLQQNERVGKATGVNLAGRGPIVVLRIDQQPVPATAVFRLPNGSSASFKNSTDANGVSREFNVVEVQDSNGDTRYSVQVTLKRNGSTIGTASQRLPAGTVLTGGTGNSVEGGLSMDLDGDAGDPGFQPPGTYAFFPDATPMPADAEAELLAELGIPDFPFPQVWDIPHAHYIQGVEGAHEEIIEVQGAGPWGDMNCDGLVSVTDIGAFVTALTDPDGYELLFPDCALFAADINQDGTVTVGDIGFFVGLLTGGS